MRRCLRLAESSGAAGERVRFYRSQQGVPIWLPDEADDASPISDEEEADEVEESEELLFSAASAPPLTDRRDYDSEHYVRVLRDSYAERLRVVFEAEDFSQLFRLDGQQGLFDRPIEQMQLRWIRCLSFQRRRSDDECCSQLVDALICLQDRGK